MQRVTLELADGSESFVVEADDATAAKLRALVADGFPQPVNVLRVE